MRDAGDDEAQMLDIDYVEALEYAMPPACGLGYSERLFWVLEGVPAREGVPFPQLRHEVDGVTKSIYPELQLELPAQATTGRKTHILDPSSERAAEAHRLEYQMVVILNKHIEIGRALNAAAHAVSGFVGTLDDPAQLDYLEYRDKTGEFDAVISHHPTIILRAGDSKELLKAYRKAQSLRLPNNAFIETMTIGSSQEELQMLNEKTAEELEFWGLVLFGRTEDVRKVTKDFQLY